MARVLVVDDEIDIRDLVPFRLEAAGHEVVVAGDAGEAVTLVERIGEVDVAVLDVGLPDVDGFALLRALRRTRPLLPAVFLTVRSSLEDLNHGQQLGALYVAKPFETVELLSAVDRAWASAEAVTVPTTRAGRSTRRDAR